MITQMLKKIKTFYLMLREGRICEVFHALTFPIVRTSVSRIDLIDVISYKSGFLKCSVHLKYKIASEEDMRLLFANWPDSEEEYERHYEVYYKFGFKRCFLFLNSENSEIAHFQFLITYDDLPIVRRVLPAKLYIFLKDCTCATQEWVYTFEKYRRQGISILAMDGIIDYCTQNGITKIFSRRGVNNLASVQMANKMGYVQIAKAYQVQFLNQQRHEGFHLIKRI